MTTGNIEQASGQSCPCLGLAGDPDTKHNAPAPEHRCYVSSPVKEMTEDHQASFCLTGRYEECPVWLAAEDEIEQEAAEGVAPDKRDARRQMEVTILRTALVAVGALSLLLVLFALIIFSAPRTEGATSGQMASQGTTGQATAPTTAPTAVLTPVPAGLSGDLSTPTPEPEEVMPVKEPPAPSEAEPASGAVTRSYVVKQGDTLFSLARAHGVTVEAVLEANGMDDPNFIFSGQTLQIPDPVP